MAAKIDRRSSVVTASIGDSPDSQRISHALWLLLTAEKHKMSERWVECILSEVASYQGIVKSDDLIARLQKNNMELLNGMLARLGPQQDKGGLRRACESIAEARFKSKTTPMPKESVLHATKLFEIPAMEVFQKHAVDSLDAPDVLRKTDEDVVRALTSALLTEACQEVVAEHYLAQVRHNPASHALCPPEHIFQPTGWKKGSYAFDPDALKSVFIGAEINDKYTIASFINSGAFGHGWRAIHKETKRECFIKTFVTESETHARLDRYVAVVLNELESSERLLNETRLMGCQHLVRVMDVIREGVVKVPKNGVTHNDFHALVTEFCGGGELFNYIVINEEEGLTKSFTEPVARFVFRQLVAMLQALYPAGSGPDEQMMHGDIKLENLVLQGTTLKLADYGSLTRVRYVQNTSVNHGTPCYNNPYFHKPEAVDVWAVGVLLFLSVTLGEIPDMEVIERYGCVPWRLMTGATWYKEVKQVGGWLAEAGCTKHCLAERGDNTIGSLLNLIFRKTKPCTVEEVASHPWLQGPAPTEGEMIKELMGRYQGITSQAAVLVWKKSLVNVTDQAIATTQLLALVERACAESPAETFQITEKKERICVQYFMDALRDGGLAEDKPKLLHCWVEEENGRYVFFLKQLKKDVDIFLAFQQLIDQAMVDLFGAQSRREVAAVVERQKTERAAKPAGPGALIPDEADK